MLSSPTGCGPPAVGFGVGWSTCTRRDPRGAAPGVGARRDARGAALGLRTGIAFPQLIVAPDGGVIVIEGAARIPGGQMADLARLAVGIDLVEMQIRKALVRAAGLARAAALRSRSRSVSSPRLPDRSDGCRGTIGPLDKLLAAPGVVQADTYLQLGEAIRPVRLDGDRRGYVIAVGDANLEALERAEGRCAARGRGE